MTYQKRVLCAAVVAGLGFASFDASAQFAVDLHAGTGTIPVASTIPSNTTTLGNGGATEIDISTKKGVMPGIRATAANPVYVKVNLTNGAKFAAIPNLVCNGLTLADSGTAAYSASTAGDIALQAGGNGFSNVTFVITAAQGLTNVASASTYGSSAFCTLSAGSALTISGLSNVTVSATVEFTNGAVQESAAAGTLTLISYVNPFTATIDGGTATTALVDATSGSDNWVTGNNKSTTTAVLGSVSFNVGVATALSASLSANTTLAAALSTGSITVSGPAIAALKTVGSGSSGLFLSDAAGCVDTTIAASYSSTAANSVTFANVTPAQLNGTAFICGLVSGNTNQISTGQLTAQLGGTAVANVTITYPSAGNVQNIGTNGTTKNAYLIHAAASTQKTSVVRVINNGANAGTLFATAYDEAGAVCGTASTSLGTINVGQMLTFTSSALQTTLGCTPSASTAKYRIVFFGGLTSFKVLNHAKDTTGTGFTLSQSQDD